MKLCKKIILSMLMISSLILVSYTAFKICLVGEATLLSNEQAIYDNFLDIITNSNELEVATYYVDDEMYFESTPVMFKNDFYKVLMDTELSTEELVHYDITNIEGDTAYIVINKSNSDYLDDTAKYYTDIDISEYYTSNNINTDMDLFNYLLENETVDIFTNIDEIKSYYNIKLLVVENIGDAYTNITYLTGDLNGYMLEGINNDTQIIFYDEDDVYGVYFSDNDFFTEEIVMNIIETLTIRK